MSINKFALIRYKTIDNCLQNRFRKWTLDDLVDACSDILYEYEGVSKGISRRTIQLDIQNMRSEKLGYNAPIKVVDRKYYCYEEKDYSITNIPLTGQDLGTLSEVVEVLKQFKGFGYFSELTTMVNKLEHKIIKNQSAGKSYISFETNDLLKGLEYIDPVHRAIIDRKALKINYQSFKAASANEFVFHAYLLKEYRNRWFVLGINHKNSLLTLALDRIISVTHAEKEKYKRNTELDLDTFYDDIIGVSKMPNQRAQLVVLRVNKFNTPYILTKPLHNSQKILKEEADSTLISIKVVWNFELERELLGFGEGIEVLSPKRLRSKIMNRLKQAANRYN